MGLPEPLEIAHSDIEGGHGRPSTGYFNGLLGRAASGFRIGLPRLLPALRSCDVLHRCHQFVQFGAGAFRGFCFRVYLLKSNAVHRRLCSLERIASRAGRRESAKQRATWVTDSAVGWLACQDSAQPPMARRPVHCGARATARCACSSCCRELDRSARPGATGRCWPGWRSWPAS
jgi:hypothetical protein